MTSRAKAFFAVSSVATLGIVYGVHYLQIQERHNMYQGVVKDEARIAQKKKQRQAEMDEQQLRRAYLGSIQNVSDPSAPAPQMPASMTLEELKKQDLKFDGCQTCKD